MRPTLRPGGSEWCCRYWGSPSGAKRPLSQGTVGCGQYSSQICSLPCRGLEPPLPSQQRGSELQVQQKPASPSRVASARAKTPRHNAVVQASQPTPESPPDKRPVTGSLRLRPEDLHQALRVASAAPAPLQQQVDRHLSLTHAARSLADAAQTLASSPEVGGVLQCI